MTEADWLTSTDPQAMLFWLTAVPGYANDLTRTRVSDRKLRLFACACCRQVWDLLEDNGPCSDCGSRGGWYDGDEGQLVGCKLCSGTGHINRSRRAVEVAERFVDGESTEYAVKSANAAVLYVKGPMSTFIYTSTGLNPNVPLLVRWANSSERPCYPALATKANLLLDIVGNPWRPFIREPKASPEDYDRELSLMEWRQWRGGAVRLLAQSIYDERRFEDMPILADALEEAGCGHADILAHCRQPGEHVRGCWVVDLVLGKE